VFAEIKNVTATEGNFGLFFGTRWTPVRSTILRLSQQFEQQGSVNERKRPGAVVCVLPRCCNIASCNAAQ
jgi:hypothetical protein